METTVRLLIRMTGIGLVCQAQGIHFPSQNGVFSCHKEPYTLAGKGSLFHGYPQQELHFLIADSSSRAALLFGGFQPRHD